jgi:hypothetical protein
VVIGLALLKMQRILEPFSLPCAIFGSIRALMRDFWFNLGAYARFLVPFARWCVTFGSIPGLMRDFWSVPG